jgi:fibronectin-binding autotransporter adhesin
MVTGRFGNAWAGAVLAAAACLLPASVRAAEFTWSGATDGDWGVATNWNTPPTFGAGNGFVFHAPGAGNLNTFLGESVRTIGGLTFNDNADTAITVRTYSNETGTGGSNRVLTLNGGSGTDAWINVATGAVGDITIAPGGARVTLGSNLVVAHNGSGNLEIGQWMDGAFSITKNGAGTLTLRAIAAGWAYSGGMNLNAGKLRVRDGRALGTGPFVMTGGTLSTPQAADVTADSPLRFSGTLVFGDATDTGAITFTSLGTGTLAGNTVLHTNSLLTLNRAIGEDGGTYSLTKTGPGILLLGNNNNSFSGGLNIDGGTVSSGNNNGRLGAAGGTLSFNGGALVWTGSLNETISRTTTLNAGGGTIGVENPNATITWANTISGAGSLTKTGPGTLVNNESYSFAGGLNLNGGIFSVANSDNRLGASGSAVSFDGGTLTFRGTGTDVTTSNRATTLNAGGGTIDVVDAARTATWAGVMSGPGGLTKTGSGALRLTRDNTYAGTTTVSAGTLLIDGTHSGVGLVSVEADAVLGGNGTIGGDLTLASDALFAFAPGITLNLVGEFAFDPSFGVGSLRSPTGGAIDWSTIADGTYTLLTGPNLPTFSAANIGNFSSDNPFSIGDGRSAYFQNGSLQLVVVPEPSTWALLGGAAAVGAGMMLRRRRKVG